MQDPWFYILWLVWAYLLGSVSAGDVIARISGVDIRTLGDGYPGARNIYREIGPRYGIAVFLLDVATGAAATVPLYLLGVPPWMRLMAVGAVLSGHIFPVFWGFRGGVGGAVAMGATFGLLPFGALIATLFTSATIVITRSSLFSVWAFFGVAVLVGGFLHQNALGVTAVLLAGTIPSFKWAISYRIRTISDVWEWWLQR